MGKWIVRRILLFIFVLWGITSMVFITLNAIPRNPAIAMAGSYATKEQVEKFKVRWGLDKPLWQRYLMFYGKLLRGDLGLSIRTERPVKDEILRYFPATFELATFIGSLALNRYLILMFILLFYILLGCVMDSLAIILLTVPIFFPLVLALGFDPIWFGIIIVRVTEIGLITPPVGLNVYIIKGVAKDVPMYTIFRGILPFLAADICHVVLLVAVPQLSLFLPGFMK